MLLKSNMSMKAATTLVSSKNQGCWNSSIHCSYYSLLQMMMYMLVDVKRPPCSMENIVNKGDTHMRIKEAVVLEICSPKERVSFITGFDMLKRMRVKADYTTEQFSQEMCLELKEKSESLRNKVVSYFKK